MGKLERKQLLRSIFVYHSLADDISLKGIWEKDLEHYFTDEIEAAWNEWRLEDSNQHKKPKPFDLIRLIRKERKSKIIPSNKPDTLVKGKDFATDLLIEQLEKMKVNMPDYEERMRECESPYEKLLIGLSALNVAEDKKNEMMSILRKIMPSNSQPGGS